MYKRQVKAKISEQQARLKELEQKKLEAENSEIVDIVRGMSTVSYTHLARRGFLPDPTAFRNGDPADCRNGADLCCHL